MATIDITAHLVPSRYDDEPDRWRTEQPMFGQKADALLLRMRCRYTRRRETFTVLYQGPGGTMRLEHGADEQPGPSGSLICQATVIAATVIARAVILDVAEHDVLILNGQRMVILDDRPQGYPRLVTEAEAGLALARTVIRERSMELLANRREQAMTEAQRETLAAQVDLLASLSNDLLALASSVRERYAAPAKR